MQADSSAKRTCNESRSTSLCTATVRIPISLHVQIILHAISPRLAIRILRKRRGPFITLPIHNCQLAISSLKRQLSNGNRQISYCFDSKKRLAVFDGLAILDVNLNHLATGLSLNLVHEFHGLDNADNSGWFHVTANPHEAFCGWRSRPVESTNDRRSDFMQILIFRSSLFSVGAGVGWRSRGDALHGTALDPARGDLSFSGRQLGRPRYHRIIDKRAAAYLDAKALALEFELGQTVLRNQPDELS